MIQAFFFDLQRATGDRGRPEEIETFTAHARWSCSAPG